MHNSIHLHTFIMIKERQAHKLSLSILPSPFNSITNKITKDTLYSFIVPFLHIHSHIFVRPLSTSVNSNKKAKREGIPRSIFYSVHTGILIGFFVRKYSYCGEEATYRSTEAKGKKLCGNEREEIEILRLLGLFHK